jgi:flagellar hook assembly protein FlgD
VTIKVRASENESVRVRIFNLAGETVKKMKVNSTPDAAGWFNMLWDGKNDCGKKVGRGLYFILIETPYVKSTKRVYVVK